MTKLFKVAFTVYLLLLFFLVFLTPNRYVSHTRQYHYHVVPLETTLDGLKGPRGQQFWPYWIDYFGNLFGNIILFVPMGVLLKNLQPHKSNRQIILTGVAISITIELMQLLFKIGVCDIDDVLLNSLGTIAGVWLWQCLRFDV